jgi:hypothetical protein
MENIEDFKNLKGNRDTYINSFQLACWNMDIESALKYALKAYYLDSETRDIIIKTIFIVCIRDKGLKSPDLFLQVYQLLVIILKKDDPVEEENNPEEKWAIVSEHPLYSVSSKGKIKLTKNDKTVPAVKNKKKLALEIAENDLINIDILVATAFVENENSYKEIQHLNGNLIDSNFKNLKWTEKEKKPAKNVATLEPILLLNSEELTSDPVRLSFVYRFFLAVRIVASAPCSNSNDYALNLFSEIVKDDDDEKSYIEEYGPIEDVKVHFNTAISDKNIADSIYYAKVLYNYSEQIQKKLKWTKVKKPYVEIWDVFTTIMKSAPLHIKTYLRCLRDLATSPNWVEDEMNQLLYIHFIHMFCLDPISSNINTKVGTLKHTVETPYGEIRGAFNTDFMVKKIIKKKRIYEAKIDINTETLLFPVNIDEIIIEPRFHKIDLKHESDSKELFLDTYNELEDDVKESDPDSEIPEDAVSYIRKKFEITQDSSPYNNLAIFYLYFSLREDLEDLEDLLGSPDEFFEESINPFDKDSDLVDTEFLSFKPYLLDLIKDDDDLTPQTKEQILISVLPKTVYQKKSNSSISYRTLKNDREGITITLKKR